MVHIHIGTLNWSPEDVVYAYTLAEMLEKELFAMLPESRRHNSYCRALTPVIKNRFKELKSTTSRKQYDILLTQLYSDIYDEVTFIKTKNSRRALTDRNLDTEVEQTDIITNSRTINKNVNHPLGTKCGYDKNAQRYCWLNFVTLLYDTKGNPNARTLEFRSHGASMNFTKIKNWLKICMAFCKFVEANKKDINQGGITLEKVLLTIYPKTGEELLKYVKERTQLFTKADESVDYVDVSQSEKTIKEVVECA